MLGFILDGHHSMARTQNTGLDSPHFHGSESQREPQIKHQARRNRQVKTKILLPLRHKTKFHRYTIRSKPTKSRKGPRKNHVSGTQQLDRPNGLGNFVRYLDIGGYKRDTLVPLYQDSAKKIAEASYSKSVKVPKLSTKPEKRVYLHVTCQLPSRF